MAHHSKILVGAGALSVGMAIVFSSPAFAAEGPSVLPIGGISPYIFDNNTDGNGYEDLGFESIGEIKGSGALIVDPDGEVLGTKHEIDPSVGEVLGTNDFIFDGTELKTLPETPEIENYGHRSRA